MRAPLALLAAGLALLAPQAALAHRCEDGNDGAYAQAVRACQGDQIGSPNCGAMVTRAIGLCEGRLADNKTDQANDTSDSSRAEHQRKIDAINGYIQHLQQLQQQTQVAHATTGDTARHAKDLVESDTRHGPAAPAGPAMTPQQTQQTQQQVQQALAGNDTRTAAQGAQALLQGGQRDLGRQALDQILAQDKDNPRARGLRAEQRLIDGDASGAVADARVALQGDPGNEAARRIVAWADSLGRDIHLKKDVKLDFASRGDADKLAEGAASGPQLASAMPFASSGAGVVGSRSQASVLTAALRSAEVANGWAKFKIGDYKGALDEADRALAKNPRDVEAWTLKARVQNAARQPQLAVEAADAALKIDPQNVAALLERGYALYELKRYREALTDVEKALSIDSMNAMGHLYRAMILERMERAKDAISEYITAKTLDASLQPIVDEALARLQGPALSGARKAATRHLGLIVGLVALALGLVGFGLRRVARPGWATPATPLR